MMAYWLPPLGEEGVFLRFYIFCAAPRGSCPDVWRQAKAHFIVYLHCGFGETLKVLLVPSLKVAWTVICTDPLQPCGT